MSVNSWQSSRLTYSQGKHPFQLIHRRRSYESFGERGLEEVRQKLRFEHYEDKR